MLWLTEGNAPKQLPWSTCNEDLVDLFSTIGKVERAEIQYEPNGRSRGTGVVEFDSAENAETAISKPCPCSLLILDEYVCTSLNKAC